MVASCEIVLFIFFVEMSHFFDSAVAKRSKYERLSLRLDKMLSEIESIRIKVEQNEDRIGDIENKINLCKPSITTDDTAQDVDGTPLALALKTLSSEKRILRETVGKIENQFGKFKSDIQKEMTEFKISVKEQLGNESTVTGSVHNSVNKSIMTLSDDMSEFKANLTSLNSMLQSVNVSVMKNANGMFDVVNSARAMAQNISSLQAHDVTVRTLISEIEGIQNHISEVTKIKPRTKSSFTARSATRLSDGVLQYGILQHNEGSEFNKDTGTFICRVPGLYMFIANVVEGGSDQNYVDCRLRKNGSYIVYIFSRNGLDSTGSFTKDGIGAATGAVTLHLSPGDSLNVWCSSLTSAVWYSSFTGCLIAEDP